MNYPFKVKYGVNVKDFSITADTVPNLILPKSIPADITPEHLVKNALEHPVGENRITSLAGKKISIAINDKTRPVPLEQLLPPLLNFILDLGANFNDIQLIVSSGSHRPMKMDEVLELLPNEFRKKIGIFIHDCDDKNNLKYYGYTQLKTPVWINSTFSSADFKIVVGCIEPHHFMGFSGGIKSAAIGLAGRETINANHSMLVHPFARIGEYELNPMRQDIEEIGDKIHVDLVLDAILNQDNQIVHVLSGSPREVMAEGIPICNELCQVKVPGLYDIVIASPGGSPKDINLYQSQKAMTNASIIVKPGGAIIVTAQCSEGIGSSAFEDFMNGVETPDQVISKFNKVGFSVGAHKAYQIAKILEKARIILVSDMDPDLVKKFLLVPASDIGTAINMACSYSSSNNPVWAVLPRAVNTIPVVEF